MPRPASSPSGSSWHSTSRSCWKHWGRSQSRRVGVRARGRRQGHAGAGGLRRATAGRTGRARGRRAARRGPAAVCLVRGGTGPRRRRGPADHRYRRAAAVDRRTGGHPDPRPNCAPRSPPRGRLHRHLRATRWCRRRGCGRPTCATANSALSLPDGAIRKPCWRCCCAGYRPGSSTSTRSQSAHRVSSSPIWPPWSRGRSAGRGAGQHRRQPPALTQDDLIGALDRDPPAVAIGHRGGGGRIGHPRRRRRHGRDQAGAHRGGAVAAAAPRHLRPPRRATRRAACCSTGRPAAARPSWCARWPVPASSSCTPSRAPS